MTEPQWEDEFAIIDKKELEKKPNLKEILISSGLVDYDALSDEEKKVYDELEQEYLDEEK